MREQVQVITEVPVQLPDTYQRMLERGDRLFKKHLDATETENLLDEVLDAYTRALEQAPDALDVLCRMAKVYLRQGDYPRAERFAKRALKGILENPAERKHAKRSRWIRREAHYALGFIHYQYGNLEKARRSFYAAIHADAFGSCRARLGLFQAAYESILETSSWVQSLGLITQAVYAFCSMLLLFPFDSERISLPVGLLLLPKLLLANLMDETGQPLEALRRYLDISGRFPGLAGVGIVISDMYRERGEYEKSRFWLEKVIERHPANLDAHYHLVRLLEQKEDYAGAIDVYQRLSRLRPGDPHVACGLGNVCYYAQKYKEALGYYETALHLGRNSSWKAMIAQSMGNIMADYLQNPDAAIAYYEMAKVLNPAEVENYIQLGLLYFHKEDYANAELVYRKALSIAPRNARLYSNMGYLRWMEGDIPSAIRYYERAIVLDDTYEIPLNNLGVIYLDSLGRIHKAIELFERSVQVNEQYALAHYNLGRAHSFLNNRLQAAACFRKAQELNRFSHELDSDELTARIKDLFDTAELEIGD
jgi:tetratricopeptide (TPR) repeat protein